MSDLPPRFQPKKRSQAPGADGARRVDANGTGDQPRFKPVRRPNAPQRQSLLGNSEQSEQPRSIPPARKPPARQAPPQPAPQVARPVNETAMGAPVSQQPAPAPRPVRRRRRRRIPIILALLLVFLLAWPVGLLIWANSKLNKIDALSGAATTDGTTYLLAGSDSRADGEIPDDTEGQRTDTIIMLHRAPNGQTSMVSLPRDTYVAIPGHGKNKLNAAYAIGGAPLLVSTVEGLTGVTIDHYVEIGMGGVRQIVDSVGGVNLCLDYDVDDPKSELVWKAGCHDTDGKTALAFARMRYSDPKGDIGRQERQRQVISAVVKKAATPGFVINPFSQTSTVGAGTKALTVDQSTGIIDLAWLAWYFRAASGEGGLTGHPPIADYNFRPGKIGQAIKLDTERAVEFFSKMTAGTLTADDMQIAPGS
ncbi:LCP family protein [Bowdeniella nasicola]|uniref:LCP family protein n=1 Tax=Bowdeniella nasicola TaxID=208480 RepID=UPI000AA769F0|nr:LCP family protein [Bowdeniella nasicola]